MAEYSRLASGKVISNGAGQTPVILPFIPDFISLDNQTRLVAGAGVTSASWMTDMGQGAAVLSTFGTGSQFIAPVGGTSSGGLTSGTGFTTFQAGISLQYGPSYFHNSVATADFSITAASPAVVTTITAHGLVSGNVIIFSNLSQTSTTGMQQMAGVPLVVTVISTTQFSVNWNASGSNYTAFNTATSTNNVGSWKQVLYPALYVPGENVITAINTSTNTITTAAPHNYQVGQEVAFRIPSPWGTVQLNSLPNILIPGSPNYFFVATVPTSTTFTVTSSLAGFTAFNPNQPFLSFPGLKFPQVVAVGDINSGSLLSNFASPSVFNGYGTTATSTINGPAIAGAFINATFQGFIIGSGIGGTAADVIYWKAYLHDVNT